MITIIVATKDRVDDLDKALLSISKQTVVPKVIVISDGSSDTTEQVCTNFSFVEFIKHTFSAGYIVRRNEAVALAQTPYVLSIDDDCILEDRDTVQSMLVYLKKHRFKSIAWPHEDCLTQPGIVHNQALNEPSKVFSFKGCSFVVHRESFLKVGGFRTCFKHQGEEEDFCLRLLDTGENTYKGQGAVIRHYESPKRSFDRMDFFGSRNLILFTLFNVPVLMLPIYLGGNLLNVFKFCIVNKRFKYKIRGLFYGFRDGFVMLRYERNALSKSTVLRFRKLKKQL